MRIRRIRYCAPYQVEDDNPYIPEAERPRMVWRTWREVGVYDDVELRQLDDRGKEAPGLRFQLRIYQGKPSPDVGDVARGRTEQWETTKAVTSARFWTADDQALLRIPMVGATLDFHGYSITVKGFVSKGDLFDEEESRKYREGSLVDEISDHDRYDLANEYVCEEWQQLPPESE